MMNKIEKAVEIVGRGIEQRFGMKTIKFELAQELQVSNANANVYWHKACKRLGVKITNGE